MATSRGHEMTISKTITFLVSIVIFISAVINITFLSIRRLHDCNLSGWWYLLFIIPTLGDALRIVACCFPGTNGNNRFGNQPSSAPKFYYLLILTTPLVFIILAYTGLLDTLINFLGI
ncbi:MAG: DUF805 domain-containing protein [Proteobacteria bacterium]|nr:DUF805 domain-containing protein [Pseudomonadota bacterium]